MNSSARVKFQLNVFTTRVLNAPILIAIAVIARKRDHIRSHVTQFGKKVRYRVRDNFRNRLSRNLRLLEGPHSSIHQVFEHDPPADFLEDEENLSVLGDKDQGEWGVRNGAGENRRNSKVAVTGVGGQHDETQGARQDRHGGGTGGSEVTEGTEGRAAKSRSQSQGPVEDQAGEQNRDQQNARARAMSNPRPPPMSTQSIPPPPAEPNHSGLARLFASSDDHAHGSLPRKLGQAFAGVTGHSPGVRTSADIEELRARLESIEDGQRRLEDLLSKLVDASA